MKDDTLNETDGATTSGDIAQHGSKITDKPERRDMKKYFKDEEDKKKKKKVIKESDGYSFYNQNDLNIFEITDPKAQEAYYYGYRQQRPQFWQQNEITSQMLTYMNSEQGKNFTVKIGDNHTFPLKYRN